MTKEEKTAYDREYRKRNRSRIKARKAAYFQRTYDPVQAAIARKWRMPQHVEYCRRPEYRVWKREYDEQRRASRYGAFAEAWRILKLLRAEIKKQQPDRFERYRQAKRHAWNPEVQRRRREEARKKVDQFIRAIGLNCA